MPSIDRIGEPPIQAVAESSLHVELRSNVQHNLKRTAELRSILTTGGPGIVPGATDCFTARRIEQAGFPVVYVTGGGAANTYLGGPDIGLVTLNELAGRAERNSDSVSVRVIAQ